MSLRIHFIISIAAAAVLGAAVAALSAGAPFFPGWLAAGLLSFVAVFSLLAAWRWAGGGRTLAWMVALAFMLRLALGITVSFGLEAFGYQDEKVQHSGYLYADAFTRDNDAWDLAHSEKPILSSFQQQIVSDQYGGALALSASIYRFLSPDAHRPFLILILTAFAAALGVPFFWKAVRKRWGPAVAGTATWVLVLYPESVLLGGSQLREPFLIGLACIGFWAVFTWRQQRRPAVLAAGISLLLMALFSWRVALVVLGILVVCFWLEYVGDLPRRSYQVAGWIGLAVAIVAVGYFSWNWMTTASNFDVGLSVHESGWVQKIVNQLGPAWRTPFLTAKGLFEPVLPAILVDTPPIVWKVIGLLRAFGWYLLAPIFLYAMFAALRAGSPRDRRLLVGLALAGLVWIVISSARAGGDQWDNPRYRTILLPWIAVVAGWGWQYARRTRDAWLGSWAAAEIIFVGFFLWWYISRYTAIVGKLEFWLMVGIILVLALMALAAPGLWFLYKKRRAAGQRLDLLAELRAFLALKPAPQPTPSEASLPAGQPPSVEPSASPDNPDSQPAALPALSTAPTPPSPASRLTSHVSRLDLLATLAFLAFAILYFLGRLQSNYPVVILTGDAGNIASYAAAQDHPDWFKLDPALGDANNTGVYATLHIPLIRALARLTGGDYGLAYVWLLLPQTFLQLLGFYIFGRVLFKNRFWAFLLAFLTAMIVINVGLGEIWGVWRDALPRVTFQSLLPYLLALVLVWKDRPARWPWLMVFAGLLVYAHPISAPAWGFAIWLSLWLLQPRDWSWRRRILVMLGLGAVFLVPIAPFAINYLSYQTRNTPADYATVMAILQAYSPANLLNIPAAFGEFLLNMTRSLLIPVGLAGFVVTWLLKKGERTEIKIVLLWAAGIFITSIVVPFGEQIAEQSLHILPIETELVRGIRYFVPLLLLFWLWPLVELAPRLALPQARRAAIGLGILLFGFWAATNRPDVRYMGQAALCLARGRLVCESDRAIDDLVVALRTQTQPGEGVFFFNSAPATTSQTLSVRYAALRPLVFTTRDNGILSYANRAALPAWLAITRQVEALQDMPDPQQRLERLVPLAVSLKATYLAIDFAVTPQALTGFPVKVIMQNDTYTLMELK